MMRWIAFFLVFAWVLPASAQTMPVRSGEHTDFTRFTVRVASGDSWSIETIDRQVRLSVANTSTLFDIENAFDRIPRSRVTALSQKGPGSPLVFDLDCACQISSFRSGENLIVIDFHDPSPVDANTVQLPTLVPGSFVFRLPTDRVPTDLTAQGKRSSIRSEHENVALPLVLMHVRSMERSHDNSYASIGNSAVDAMEQRLIAQIARAETQGLIEPRPRQAAPTPPLPIEVNSLKADHEKPAVLSVRNLAVTTSIDRDLAGIGDRIMSPTKTDDCIPTRRVNMQGWATDSSFSAQVGHWRTAMIGEFDRADSEIVEALARTYLYFGFGIEARQALSLAQPQLQDHDVFEAMAQVLDGGPLPLVNPFAGQQACDTDAALWATLTEPGQLDDLNEEAVKKAANRLPAYVRELVGPRLAREFARNGRKDLAESVLRSVDRIAESPRPELELAHASAADLRGEPETAQEMRIEVALGDNEHSPAALIETIEAAARKKHPISPELVSLAEAYVTEFRNSEISAPLERGLVMALALNGDFTSAFTSLEDLESHEDRNATELRVVLLELMSERAADLDFLRQALHQTTGFEDELPEPLANALANRFLELGFARPAQRLLSAANANPPTRERRILRARAALAANLPREALVAVLGLSGPDVTELRAEAAVQTRNHSEAASLFAQTGQSDQAIRSSWLADADPADMSTSSEERYRQIFEQIDALSDVSGAASDLTPLARAQTLIEQSNSTRVGIRALLDAASIN